VVIGFDDREVFHFRIHVFTDDLDRLANVEGGVEAEGEDDGHPDDGENETSLEEGLGYDDRADS